MLVLGRKVGDQVVIADSIRVTVLGVCGSRVRLGFTASSDVCIWRGELEDSEPQAEVERGSPSTGARAGDVPQPGSS